MGMRHIAGETDGQHRRRARDAGRHEHRVVDPDRYRLAEPRQHHIGESGNVRGGDDNRLITLQQRRGGRVGRVEGGKGQDALGIEIADSVRIGLSENGHLRRRHHVAVDGHLDRDVGIGTDLSADRDGEPSPFGDLHGTDPRGRVAEQRDTHCCRRVELLPDGGRRVGEDQPVRKSVRGGAHGVARHRLQHRELLCRKCSSLEIDDGRPVDTGLDPGAPGARSHRTQRELGPASARCEQRRRAEERLQRKLFGRFRVVFGIERLQRALPLRRTLDRRSGCGGGLIREGQ